MRIRAVLFDIDGTLVDSNYLHIDAWGKALAEVGHPVDSWRVHRCIGMDGDTMLGQLAPAADASARRRATALHEDHYLAAASRLRPFEGARDLLSDLAARALTVVLATSAPESELALLRSVLDVEDAVSVITSSADVDTAKPAPDIVEVALHRAGVLPAEAVMIGDTVWDAQAAGRAGVASIGVLSGGISVGELLGAGALTVYSDVADLHAHLADGPLSDPSRDPAENS